MRIVCNYLIVIFLLVDSFSCQPSKTSQLQLPGYYEGVVHFSSVESMRLGIWILQDSVAILGRQQDNDSVFHLSVGRIHESKPFIVFDAGDEARLVFSIQAEEIEVLNNDGEVIRRNEAFLLHLVGKFPKGTAYYKAKVKLFGVEQLSLTGPTDKFPLAVRSEDLEYLKSLDSEFVYTAIFQFVSSDIGQNPKCKLVNITPAI